MIGHFGVVDPGTDGGRVVEQARQRRGPDPGPETVDKFGQAVAAVIQLREGFDEPSLAEVKDHLRPLLAGYKAPRSLVVVDQIRRSPSGKADYRWAKDTVSVSG